MLFKDLKLDALLLKAIDVSGFKQPTAIQQKAIPVVLTGRDLMASAQTGTGKTAAFVLPAMQHLLKPPSKRGNGPRVLVLTPTRELAMQVNNHTKQLGKFCRFTTGNVVGGMPYPPQIRLLRNPVDILVATPGRLMDHMEQGRVDLSRLEILVLDEADRMLDMGFVDAVKMIAKNTPKERQTLLFSATLEGKILTIARQLLKDPARIQLTGNRERHASIKQQLNHADNDQHKHDLLSHHLQSDALTKAIIFTATKRGADRLAKKLSNQGHKSAALHGDMRQGARKRTIEHMCRGKFHVLVATDVAARGLDIKGISHVINFNLPMVAEDYIHRIGRTGRAGEKGKAISLVGPEDWRKLTCIERLTGRKLERKVISGLEPTTSEPNANNKRNNSQKKPNAGYKGKKRPGKPKRNTQRTEAPKRGKRNVAKRKRAQCAGIWT